MPIKAAVGERRTPAWARVLIGLCGALLAVNYLSEVGAFGFGSGPTDFGDATYLILIATAAALCLAGAWSRHDLGAWGLIGIGVAIWALGEIYFQIKVDPVQGPYPSPADYLYFAFYLFVIAGLFQLSRRGQSGSWSLGTVIVPLLGLATLWSWFALDPVIGTLEGSTASRLTTVAYPFLDLLLVCSALAAFATLGWRAGTSLLMLIGGVTIIGVADSVYAAQVSQGAVPDQTVIDSLWPTGALLIAAAPWVASRDETPVAPARGASRSAFALGGIGVAVLVMVWDHFARLGAATVFLAAATLIAAAAQLVVLYSEAVSARRKVLESERERSRIEALQIASVEGALDGIVTADADGRVLDWNPAAERIFGYSREEAVGELIADLIVPEAQRETHQRGTTNAGRGGKTTLIDQRLEMTGRHADGGEIPVELAITRSGSDPVRFTAFIRDITEGKRRDEERDRLADMVRSAQDAMVSASLDGVVLSWNQAAERIYGYRPEEIVGSEMRLLVPPDKIQRAEKRRRGGQRRRVNLDRDHRPPQGRRDHRHLIAGLPGKGPDRPGDRRVDRHPRHHGPKAPRARKAARKERQAWRGQIEDALDHGGFEFHPQPVLDLDSGEITHHELLLRMRMNGEVVAPGSFLSHAETSPLMRRVERWTIRHGIELAAEHPVAINLSATSLSDPGTVAAAEKALGDFGVDPRDVIFEITETAAVEDLEAAHTLVKALGGLGCGVALDDFGTGYGSFTYLMRLNVTSLKIDMEFIRGLTEDPDDQRVVRAIVAVARNFGLSTVAEGVETQATVEILRSLGVDQAQGYLIGRPSQNWTTSAEVASHLTSPGGR